MSNANTKAEVQAATSGAKISGVAIALVLTAIVVLIGLAIYVTFPTTGNHFWALVAIGILGIIVALLAVFVQAMSRDPAMARAASWGSYFFGVVVLFGAGLVAPDYIFTGNSADTGMTFVGLRIVYFILVLFIVVAGLLVMRWRLYAKASDIRREANRSAWRQATGISTGSPGAPSMNDPRNYPPGK
jgi:hypothetical protein